MTDAQRLAALEAENAELREQLDTERALARRALASYQQRALHMEIIRQQNEDLDRLAVDLDRARAQAEKSAREAETAARLKSEFLANFSHEIRTPLNDIIGYCDLLAREEGERLTLHGRRDLSTIRSNARTLLALINDILDLSKIEAGQAEVVVENVNARELVEETCATVREQLRNKDVSLRAHVDDAAATLRSDGLKLRQILLNLLSNAVKFTDVGEVSLSLLADGGSLVLRVEDTGCGIPAAELEHVFEKFRQVDGSRSRRAGGTGLGLAIVKELTRLLDGKLEVKSSVGRGSCFSVTLPGAVAPSRASSRPAPGDTKARYAAKVPVLVVDDDPLLQQLLGGQLESEGFEVQLASDGLTAVGMARELRPAVIVLDIHLPRLDGWGVMSSLKSDRSTSAIPIIIISIEEQRARGLSLGAFEYLVKPIEPNHLSRVVSRALSPGHGEVLVVDDDADTRTLVRRSLEAVGIRVDEAADGREALRLAREKPPALVVLDLMMPELDGFEVLRRLRQRGVDCPVVVLTGKELTERDREVLAAGLAQTVAKDGVSMDELVQQARTAVLQTRQRHLPRVLYVEDIAQNRDIVRRYLAGQVLLFEAEDGEAGLAAATANPPDLILMDLSLPRLDGWEVTRRLKQNPVTAHVPVVALTAHVTDEDRSRAHAAGCEAYLTKPVDPDQLLETIRQRLPAGVPQHG